MTTPSLEREVKLDVEPHYEQPSLDGVVEGATAVALPLVRLAATYYDTPDLRLLRRGLTLRQRKDRLAGGENLWTLKLPTRTSHAALARDEFSWPGSQADIPAAAVRLVVGVIRHAHLVPVAKLLTTRRRSEVLSPSGERLVEVDDDLVTVVSGVRQGLRFREVEIELGAADEEVLAKVVDVLIDAGARPGSSQPKLNRALGLGHLETFDVEPLGPPSTVEDMVRATLAAGVDRLVGHDPGIRAGETDTEYVHQARVATRRLRSDLKTLGIALDETWVERQRSDLQWLGGLLGAVRDADVLDERLRAVAAAHADDPATPEGHNGHNGHDPSMLDAEGVTGLLEVLRNQRQTAQDALLEALDSDRYLHLLEELSTAVAQPPLQSEDEQQPLTNEEPIPSAREQSEGHGVDRGGSAEARAADPRVPLDPDTPAGSVLPALLARRWRKLRRAVRRAEREPSDALLHRVRIRAKQLRYAAEAAQPVLGRRARRLAEAAEALQTELGELHDAVAAAAWLRQVARVSTSELAFAAGQLSIFEEERRAQYHGSWHSTWEAARRQAPDRSGSAGSVGANDGPKMTSR